MYMRGERPKPLGQNGDYSGHGPSSSEEGREVEFMSLREFVMYYESIYNDDLARRILLLSG